MSPGKTRWRIYIAVGPVDRILNTAGLERPERRVNGERGQFVAGLAVSAIRGSGEGVKGLEKAQDPDTLLQA